MSFPFVSIIIPVYNSKKFLCKCFDSIVNQTMKNFEVIIINDGSTDESLDIIKLYCDKYENFSFLNKKNSGVSDSRNLGLKIAKGEFISFIDSDDFISPDFLQVLYSTAKKNNADIVNCNYIISDFNTGKNKVYPFKLHSGIYANPKALRHLIYDCRLHYYIWNKLWKRSLFTENHLCFNNMCFEDTDFSVKAFYNAKKIIIIDNPMYYYVKHSDSLVSSIKATNINDYLKALLLIRQFLESKNDFNKYRFCFLIHSVRNFFNTLKLILLLHLHYKNKKGLLKNILSSIRFLVFCNSKHSAKMENFDNSL